MALRINNTRNPGIRNRERDIEKHIALQNPSHPGHMFNRSWLESFEVEISEGNHQFLVYKPMLEPLCIFPLRFVNGRSPLLIAKAYIRATSPDLTIYAENARFYTPVSNLFSPNLERKH